MKLSLTGPLMGPSISVYLEEIQAQPFKAGDEIPLDDASTETIQKASALVDAGLAVPCDVPASEGKEID